VHDYSALKFCKAISSTYDENSTYQNIMTQQEEKKNFRTPLCEKSNS
jgi:hypothetical protein